MTGEHVRVHITLSVDDFLYRVRNGCTQQDPVKIFRVTNDVIFITVSG
jgi:uncharacterized protein (DUF2267 family)